MSDNEEPRGATGSALHIDGIPKFAMTGDPNELCEKWKKWKRSFELYIRAKAVKDEDQKTALLLHCGGMDLQELYYTLCDDDKSYTDSLQLLDTHFTPKKNVPYERHLFRKMSQKQDETVDQFAYRLRRKAAFCDFEKTDDMIRDQLIEACHNQSIRRKFLESASNNDLGKLLEMARSIEAVELQLREMKMGASKEEHINALGKLDRRRRVARLGNPKKEGKDAIDVGKKAI